MNIERATPPAPRHAGTMTCLAWGTCLCALYITPHIPKTFVFTVYCIQHIVAVCPLLLAPQSGALRISAYRDFLPSHPNPTYSFRALKPFYGDLKQYMQTKADQCRASQTKAGINFAKFYNFQKLSKL